MVLTDRQRRDLHAGIYEYLLTRDGDAFAKAAEAIKAADPQACTKDKPRNGSAPLLEKKWTAIPRLQKKVLELERAAAHSAKIHAHRGGTSSGEAGAGGSRRMLPRLPATHTLQGHAAVVNCVRVHPVFTVVVSGSEDGTIKAWDHESGDYVRTLKGHTNTVTSLAFTPSGSHLASSSTDLSIKLWDFKEYACIRTLRGHDHTISAVEFLPSFGHVSSTGSPTTESSLKTGMDVESVGSQFLVSASRDKTVKVWDVETGFCEQTLTDHYDWVRCIAVRQHDGAFATSGNDTVIQVYNKDRSKICELRGHQHVVETVAFLAEAKDVKASKSNELPRDYLVSGGRDRSVRLWKVSGVECLATFNAHENWVRAVQIHPSGNYLISAGDDKTIRVLDIKAQRCLRTLDSAHPHFVTSLSIHPTLPILVSGGVDTTVKCWMLD
mmetsp:Transcript_17524/g.25967  ORF Transcript_17524/g.25967 Transcript_17524/m.25967 type:complete len:438 (-) Transcript_17524:164-1477(-)|eukprot:CAMPEP_0194028608 /NCGR_PEP_ID=MMETSP0009_2-20130614/2538_1 /TAXON_ID=210454 /ORGANISM="Grammatophora oceanica, Strain CCMP 410" /LENGTH=437 /DNA_ID=CAMNT_0038668053 /DNA_START=70 /DNA_END=1383 /DNA_ORIENTATION=-